MTLAPKLSVAVKLAVPPTVVEAELGLTIIEVRVALDPVPVKGRVAVEAFPALILKLPCRVPAAVGVKVTLTWQNWPTGKVAGQLFVCAKSPVTATATVVALAEPLFPTGKIWAALVLLTC